MTPTANELATQHSSRPVFVSIHQPRAGAAQLWQWLGLAALILLYIAARVWHLSAICLDGDEIFSLVTSRLPWRELTVAAVRDSVHPPLFYYMLKLWTAVFGESLFALRSLPMLLSVLCLAPILYLCRTLRLTLGETSGVIGVAALHPMLIYYAQHVRMYSLLYFCTTLSLALFFAALRRTDLRIWIFLSVANIVLVYAHYFGWVLIAIEGLSVVFWHRERMRRFIAACGLTLAAFSPWIYAAAAAASRKGGLDSNLSWVPRPTISDFRWFFIDLAGCTDLPLGTWVPVCLWIVIAAAVLRAAKRRERQLDELLTLVLVVLVPAYSSFLLSLLLRDSIWGHRHIIFTVVPFLIVCTVAWRFAPRAVRIVALAVLGGWSLFTLARLTQADHRKIPLDAMIAAAVKTEVAMQPALNGNHPGDIELFAVGPHLHYPLSFYLDGLRRNDVAGTAFRADMADRQTLAPTAARFRVHRTMDIDAIHGAHFWIAYSVRTWPGGPMPESLMAARACRVGETISSHDQFDTVRLFPVWCGPS